MKLTQTYTIDDLFDGCKAGDRRVQELLYRQIAPKMLAVCMRYTKNQTEAEDVLQLGFIKVFTKIKEYRGDGSFEGWIRKVMVNTAIENYRKSLRSLKIVEIDEAYEQPSTQSDSNSDGFSRLGMEELMALIHELADGYKIVFNMYVIEGFSHKEIAETLGISEGASKSQLSRGKVILKQKIKKMEDFGYATYTG